MERTSGNSGGNHVDTLFKAGAHFAYTKARRHPSAAAFIFGVKNKVELFDLEKTSTKLQEAKEFIEAAAKSGKPVLFMGSKNEGRDAVKAAAEKAGQPYVASRWIGGTITNYPQIKKRIEKLERLLGEKERGELIKYTKKERLLIDREIIRLQAVFGGIVSMKGLPAAIIILDPKREHIVMAEAAQYKIPVVALANSDCDLREPYIAIPGNDSSRATIEFVMNELAEAALTGKRNMSPVVAAVPAETQTA